MSKQSNMLKALDWAYEKAINGLPGVETAEEMGDDYLKGPGSLKEKVNSLIRWQVVKSSTSGFLAGLPGLVAMPVTLPLNITSVLYVQLRMIAAIAHMCGHDVKSDRVKTLCYLSLVGDRVNNVLKKVGVQVGKKFTHKMISNISGKALTEINKRVGFRLVTKFGEKGVINLGKCVPLIGGLIGGSCDGYYTNKVGDVAYSIFRPSSSSSFRAA